MSTVRLMTRRKEPESFEFDYFSNCPSRGEQSVDAHLHGRAQREADELWIYRAEDKTYTTRVAAIVCSGQRNNSERPSHPFSSG